MNARLEPHDLRLKIVEADKVLLHEETDPARVDRLTDYLLRDGSLRNPPLAARTDDDRYAILDGATRTTALKQLGAKYILVQVVPYDGEGAQVEAWYHVLPDEAARRATKFVEDHANVVEETSIEEAQLALAERRSTAALTQEDGRVRLLTLHDNHLFHNPTDFNGRSDAVSPSSVLRSLVSVYGGAGEIYRIVHKDLVDIVREADVCPAVVMFPTFTPAEILGVAMSGDLLPAGITRHLITGRALNVNIPLVRLFTDTTKDEKNAWLKSWLTQKILDKKVRYYHEPVFIFDD